MQRGFDLSLSEVGEPQYFEISVAIPIPFGPPLILCNSSRLASYQIRYHPDLNARVAVAMIKRHDLDGLAAKYNGIRTGFGGTGAAAMCYYKFLRSQDAKTFGYETQSEHPEWNVLSF